MSVDKLDEMVGKTFIYNVRHHKVLSWRQLNGKVVVVTDKDWIEIDETDLDKQLKTFLLAEDHDGGRNLAVMQRGNKNILSELASTVLDNIDAINKNGTPSKEVLAKVNATNSSINALINLAKIEIQLKKMKDKG